MITVLDEQLLTQKELIKMLNVSESTFRKWKKGNHLPEPVQIGSRPYWHLSSISEWLKLSRINQQQARHKGLQQALENAKAARDLQK